MKVGSWRLWVWDRMENAAGTVIGGKYRIESVLGEGGMGVVYRATDTVLERAVALKLIRPDVAMTGEMAERFKREAMALARVRHPGVVQLHEVGVQGGSPWMALELLEGETLEARLGRGPLEVGQAAWVINEVLQPLMAVHARAIVHRDIKPSNIFLELDDAGQMRVRLLDFGVAHQQQGAGALTRTGQSVGTPQYMSPEQLRSTRETTLDGRTDLYSLGVVLYECLSGQLPFEGDSVGDLAVKVFTEQPRDLRACSPGVPDALADVVARCLSRDRAGRPDSASALGVALHGALESSRTDAFAFGADLAGQSGDVRPPARNVSGTPRPAGRPAWSSSQRIWVGLLATVIALLLLTIGWLAARRLGAGDPVSSPARPRVVELAAPSERAQPAHPAEALSGNVVVVSEEAPDLQQGPPEVESTQGATPGASADGPRFEDSEPLGPARAPSGRVGAEKERDLEEFFDEMMAPRSAEASSVPQARSTREAGRRDLDELIDEIVGGAPPARSRASASPNRESDSQSVTGSRLPEVLSRNDVVRAMKRVAGRAKRCGGGKKGTAMVKVEVSGRNGRVVEAEVTNAPFRDTREGACIEGQVSQAIFPMFRKPYLTINYPFKIY